MFRRKKTLGEGLRKYLGRKSSNDNTTLETRFQFYDLPDSFSDKFWKMPLGYFEITITHRDRHDELVRTDFFCGEDRLFLFQHAEHLTNLYGSGHIEVKVTPYSKERISKYSSRDYLKLLGAAV